LLGAAETLRRRAGRTSPAWERDELARITAGVREAAPGFADLFARGGELTPEQARSLLDADRA
jgi:hypothetical protein